MDVNCSILYGECRYNSTASTPALTVIAIYPDVSTSGKKISLLIENLISGNSLSKTFMAQTYNSSGFLMDQGYVTYTVSCTDVTRYCRTCFSANGACDTCYPSFFINNGFCVSDCGNVTNYRNYANNSTGICAVCTNSCQTCLNATYCTSCNSSLFLLLPNNTCITNCSSLGYMRTNSTNGNTC